MKSVPALFNFQNHDICYSAKLGAPCKMKRSLETEWQHTGAHARLATQNLTHTQIKEKK